MINALTLTSALLIPDADHRSHFGSRYTSGCCDLAGLFSFESPLFGRGCARSACCGFHIHAKHFPLETLNWARDHEGRRPEKEREREREREREAAASHQVRGGLWGSSPEELKFSRRKIFAPKGRILSRSQKTKILKFQNHQTIALSYTKSIGPSLLRLALSSVRVRSPFRPFLRLLGFPEHSDVPSVFLRFRKLFLDPCASILQAQPP